MWPRIREGGFLTKVKETARIDLARESPFLTIWTRPRATMRAIVDTNPSFRVLPIAMVGGVLQAIQLEASIFAGEWVSISTLLVIAVVFGPLVGVALLYLGAWLVELSCRLLRGEADSREVRSVLAWSSVPILATIPLWILRIALLGRELFTFDKPSYFSSPILRNVVIASTVPELVLSVWWMVVTVKALAEVQRFSAWRAFNSMLLLIVPPMILIVILAIGAGYLLTKLLY